MRIAIQSAPRPAGTRRTRAIALAVGLLLAGAAVAGCAREPAGSAALPALRPLDEAGSAQFRQAFDEAADRPRYVVALSPT